MRALFVAGLAIQGCEKDCVGVGCLERFGAASAAMHLGRTIPDQGRYPPTEASLTVRGTNAQGPDWDVAIVPDHILVGSQLDSTVRAYRPVTDEFIDEADSVGAMVGEHATDAFGHRVRAISNIDGGLDLLVTAPRLSTTAAIRHVGAVYRFPDIGSGWEGGVDTNTSLFRLQGDSPGGLLGASLEVCPDMDGDDAEEWVAAATRDASTAQMGGQVILGRSLDLEGLPQQLGVSVLTTRWDGNDLGGLAGKALDCRSDLDGDGVPDLVIGAPFADQSVAGSDEDAVGAVYIMTGATPAAAGQLRSKADLVLQIGQTNDWFGWSVSTGDLDGDLLADLVVGSPGSGEALGQVTIWSGASLLDEEEPEPQVLISGAFEASRFGWSTHVADVNGDGQADLIVGAPYTNPTEEDVAYNAGQISIFYGGKSFDAWPQNPTSENATLIYTEPAQYLRSGESVFSGNFDGDERTDLVFLHRAEGG